MTRIAGRTPFPSALNAARRARELRALADQPRVDVLVIGGGITGAGLALDAVTRGLRTVLVERGDLAFGTSRWSSKLVHGGLRYLAGGQVGIAYESAVERHLLMTRIAPHLTRPLAQLMPLYAPDHLTRGGYIGAGYVLGDLLRRGVGTPASLLPPPGVLSAEEVVRSAPGVRRDELHGGIRGWDGRLFDDARLVVAVARTAAGYGASVLTRVEAVQVTGDGAVLRDALTGAEFGIGARAVLNATGVWAGGLDPDVHLRPSRGTHLVVDAVRLGAMHISLTAPVPGSHSRFVFTLPAPHGRAYIGVTDVPADGPIPDVPEAVEGEVDGLLAIVNDVLRHPLERADVLATFSGLRPLLAGAGDDATSDLSRRHAILESTSGVLSVVGGKLTTYRRMAEDGVDAAIARRFVGRRPCRTRDLPLVGAWPRHRMGEIAAPARLVRRYGAEAPFAASLPAAPGAARGVTAQELQWGVAVEGALTVDDLLDRRTRLGLVAADRDASRAAAVAAFDRAGVTPAARRSRADPVAG